MGRCLGDLTSHLVGVVLGTELVAARQVDSLAAVAAGVERRNQSIPSGGRLGRPVNQHEICHAIESGITHLSVKTGWPVRAAYRSSHGMCVG